MMVRGVGFVVFFLVTVAPLVLLLSQLAVVVDASSTTKTTASTSTIPQQQQQQQQQSRNRREELMLELTQKIHDLSTVVSDLARDVQELKTEDAQGCDAKEEGTQDMSVADASTNAHRRLDDYSLTGRTKRVENMLYRLQAKVRFMCFRNADLQCKKQPAPATTTTTGSSSSATANTSGNTRRRNNRNNRKRRQRVLA